MSVSFPDIPNYITAVHRLYSRCLLNNYFPLSPCLQAPDLILLRVTQYFARNFGECEGSIKGNISVASIISVCTEAGDFFYFLLGQFLAGQCSQFSSSSFSMPKGIISPHRQTQPSKVFVCNCSSQRGRQALWYPSCCNDTLQCRSPGMMHITRESVCHGSFGEVHEMPIPELRSKHGRNGRGLPWSIRSSC